MEAFRASFVWLSQVFVEYVMLRRVNDSEEQANQLGALLQGRAVVLNLIPWNPVYSPEFEFEAPGHERTELFQSIVRQYGVHCTVRQEKGQDISGIPINAAVCLMCLELFVYQAGPLSGLYLGGELQSLSSF